MKQLTINTPFGKWQITEVSKDGILKLESLKSGEILTIQSNVSFHKTSIGSLVAWAKVHNHKFPNPTQMEFIEYLYNHYLKEWILEEKISFDFPPATYITNEILSATINNPYGDDFVFNKYVCYDTYCSCVKVVDNKDNAKYILILNN